MHRGYAELVASRALLAEPDLPDLVESTVAGGTLSLIGNEEAHVVAGESIGRPVLSPRPGENRRPNILLRLSPTHYSVKRAGISLPCLTDLSPNDEIWPLRWPVLLHVEERGLVHTDYKPLLVLGWRG